MDWAALGTDKVLLWGGFLMVAAEAGFRFLEDGMDEMRGLLQLTEEQWASVTGALLAVGFAVITWAAKRTVSWLRSDGANVKQRALFDSLVKRLNDPLRDWREIGEGNPDLADLHEFDVEGVLISAASPFTGRFLLSGDRADTLLTKRQQAALRRHLWTKLAEVREEKRERELAQAIVQASRS